MDTATIIAEDIAFEVFEDITFGDVADDPAAGFLADAHLNL